MTSQTKANNHRYIGPASCARCGETFYPSHGLQQQCAHCRTKYYPVTEQELQKRKEGRA